MSDAYKSWLIKKPNDAVLGLTKVINHPDQPLTKSECGAMVFELYRDKVLTFWQAKNILEGIGCTPVLCGTHEQPIILGYKL